MSTLFISDLHLCATRPEITAAFEAFLAGPARKATALYILGDLFEYWAGDDDLGDPFNTRVATALAGYGRDVPTFLMHGNRDFLMGDTFARVTGVTLIADPLLIDIEGSPTLLMHGDTLCTDDLDYQRFRGEVRSAEWSATFLATPLAERKQRIEAMRTRSEALKRVKTAAIMDVNAAAVAAVFRRYDCSRLIHGHTHRPARHEHLVDGCRCERLVLADWHENGSHLACDAGGCVAANNR